MYISMCYDAAMNFLLDLMCAFGKQSSMCYSGYLDDCDNSTMTRLDCASGCFCPSGLVQFDTDLCVEQDQCLDGMKASSIKNMVVIGCNFQLKQSL